MLLTGESIRHLISCLLTSNSDVRIKVNGRGYSMIPFIKDGDTVIIRPIDPQRGIKFGDVIAALDRNLDRIVVHRVIRLEKGRYQTKGDYNRRADPWWHRNQIIGLVEGVDRCNRFPFPHCSWQNVLIAIASKTGLLNWIVYPVFRYLKDWLKTQSSAR